MNQTQFQAPQLTKINKYILIGAGICFLASAILKAIGAFSLVKVLGLSGSGIFSGMIFQLVTYPLVETQLLGFLFNALLVWFIGSELETLWGSKTYLRFLLLTVVAVGLIYVLVNFAFFFGTYIYATPLHGLAGMNLALLVAYATLYPDRQLSMMMIFPMRARTFCWILVAIQAYYAVFSSLTSSWAHLLGMGISYLLIRYQSKPLIHKVMNSSFSFRRNSKKRLYVVKDDDQNPPKYWQ
jgi:membrane associated rhomboid family serine protease